MGVARVKRSEQDCSCRLIIGRCQDFCRKAALLGDIGLGRAYHLSVSALGSRSELDTEYKASGVEPVGVRPPCALAHTGRRSLAARAAISYRETEADRRGFRDTELHFCFSVQVLRMGAGCHSHAVAVLAGLDTRNDQDENEAATCSGLSAQAQAKSLFRWRVRRCAPSYASLGGSRREIAHCHQPRAQTRFVLHVCRAGCEL